MLLISWYSSFCFKIGYFYGMIAKCFGVLVLIEWFYKDLIGLYLKGSILLNKK